MTDEISKLWGAADAYERYMGRWSRKIAPLFVDRLAAPQGKSWADIGCGTGQLSVQIARKCSPSRQIGIDTTEGFLTQANEHVPNAELRVGEAQNIDLSDGVVDYAVSGLVLNFIPADQRHFPRHLPPRVYPKSRQPPSTYRPPLRISRITGRRSWAVPAPRRNIACR